MSPSSRSFLRRNTRAEEPLPENDPLSALEEVPGNSTQAASSNEPQTASSSDPAAMQRPQVLGYYNHFHTRSRPTRDDASPPDYDVALRQSKRGPAVSSRPEEGCEALPPYTCTVFAEGVLGLKPELSSPFQHAMNRHWRDVYVVLCGTQLLVYKLKSAPLLSKGPQAPRPGRLLRAYTLQHAEVGIASDFKKSGPVPRSTFVRLCSTASQQKLYETDPHLFEPIREFTLRLRIEEEQFLLCCSTQEQLLDWVEALCMSVDISMPLDERTEPRYRSLPRRGRRRQAFVIRLDSGGNLAAGRRLVEEQERILRTLYPQLADSDMPPTGADRDSPSSRDGEREHPRETNGDPEAEDLDPSDVMFLPPLNSAPELRPFTIEGVDCNTDPFSLRPLTSYSPRPSARSSLDGSVSKPTLAPTPQQTDPAALLRFRRRCAPSLLASSPRSSDVLFIDGKRWKVYPETQTIRPWELQPPRYGDHGFTKVTQTFVQPNLPPQPVQPLGMTVTTVTTENPPRPEAMVRAESSLSAVSADSSSSRSHDSSTEPAISTTAITHLSPEVAVVAKRISSESSMRGASPARAQTESAPEVRPVTPPKGGSDDLPSTLPSSRRKSRVRPISRGREGARGDPGRLRSLVRLF